MKKPYPQATQPSLGLDKIPKAGTFVTRGRLEVIDGDHWTLFSEGLRQKFQTALQLELAPQYLAADCLRQGDIIEVLSQIENEIPVIKGVFLLVPTLREGPFVHQKFDYAMALQWQEYMATLRSFFIERKFVELRTPTLVSSPGLEPFLDPFVTEFKNHKEKRAFYLPTSPEFHLKKALTLGFERCFEFKECFRNNELSAQHQPEFLMLEWYRSFADNSLLIKDLRDLFSILQKKFSKETEKPIAVLTMANLWKEVLDFELTPQTQFVELTRLAEKLKIKWGAISTFDDLFNLIFLERIEPVLHARKEPVIVWQYPPSQAALARITPDGWADRFEIYWRGFEIANAFHELNDVSEQRKRFVNDQKKKRELGKSVVPIDEELMAALEWGMPPSAGIALGVERLFLALHRLQSLNQARLFPILTSSL